jgi:hypothetical protein
MHSFKIFMLCLVVVVVKLAHVVELVHVVLKGSMPMSLNSTLKYI